MKKLILSLILAAVTTVGYSQTTNSWLSSPVMEFLNKTNLIVATYAIADTTTHEWGGGVGLGFKLNDYLVPTLRFDYLGSRLWVPSANLQLQVPIDIAKNENGAAVRITLFSFSGLATSFNSWQNDDNGSPVGIFGIGGAVALPRLSKNFLVLADYERWTGGPFNDNQVRFGLGWKF